MFPTGSLHLPKRPEIPERPRNIGKTSEWFNTCLGEGPFDLIFKHVLFMSIFEYSANKKYTDLLYVGSCW